MSNDASQPLRAVIAGAGRMGLRHAQVMAETGEFEVAAVCDVDEGAARRLADELDGVRAYTALEDMLDGEKPDVVTIATPGSSHASLTIAAANSGVGGICCEKPMATCMAEARAMVEACRENGVGLVINHQRRMGRDLVEMGRLIREGAVGDVYLIRGTCAGDVLGDGTHLVNSIRALGGDADVLWVFGQVYRLPPDADEPKGMGHVGSGGYRYGYPVESGAIGVFEFRSGIRAEILTGDLGFPGRNYQDYEVFGTKGRLWRPGDEADPALLIWDEQGGGWRQVPVDGHRSHFEPMVEVYRAFARTVRKGACHPLAGESVLKGLEVVMAVHESARTHRRIDLPLRQGRFPLQLMIEAGQL